MRQNITLTILLFFTFVIGFAQNGSIVGKVQDKEVNNDPLPFANVTIKGTSKGTTSDFDGLYELKDVAPGTYTLIFSFVGYKTQEVENVVVNPGKITNVDVILAVNAAALDAIVITATTRKISEAATLLEQKKSKDIKQIIGAEELARKGVGDAAGAVTKISGVSKQEGSSNVYVRGLGDRYLNTTLNGLPLPSNDIEKKNIELGLFATDVIENVSISKAYSGKQYGDFAAGNVNINSKDYKGKGYVEAFVGSSINTNAIGENFVVSEGSGFFGDYARHNQNPFAVILSHGVDPEAVETPININFGISGGKSWDFENGARLSAFGTVSFENGYEYRRGEATDFTTVEKKSFQDAEEFEYSTTTTAMGTLNFKINDDNKLKFNSLFINSSTNEVGYFGIDGKGRNRDAILNTDEGFYQMNAQFDQNQVFVNQLIGNHKKNKIEVDWAVGYNLVFAKQPDRKRISIENYQFALDADPTTNPTFFSNVDYDNQRYFQDIDDTEFNGRINLAYDVNENFKLNFGYNGRSKERNFENIRYGYDIVDSNFQITDVDNLNSIFNIGNFNADGGAIYDIRVINAIPDLGNTNRPGLAENTYTGNLDLFAGYVDAEIKSEKWLIVPGVRFESFDQSIAYDVINLGNNGNSSRSAYENFILPSINVKYALSEEQNIRFSASRTVSLPEFKETAPFVYIDVTNRIGGNPDLLGATDPNFVNVSDKSYSNVLNFDLKYEWFFGKGEIFSASAFAKQISDPVNRVVAFDATGTQRYFRTGETAEVYGVEFEFRKNILQNEDEETLLSAGINTTLMHTQQDLYDEISGTYSVSFRENEEQLQGASPFIINADVSYSPTFGSYKPTGNLVFSYFSDRIDALGSGQLGNIVEKSVPTLDFILKNKITDDFEINFSVRNILNPDIKFVRETSAGDVLVTSANGKGVSGYDRGRNIGFQLKYKF
ncbi:TonB-dependent receptor SusC [Kordia sp. SMS9]|uniref:TonB-dependent receptor n=1 Tax=Kordia sp. SMS9 TaxID=2282170 RepID=UPI000E0D835A|nr:TonB-dependent receptor [Kordia sp. SMS9]AXG68399.1 TonB-dependent receptor SusC [Kordia sp. SMS9]